MFYSIEKMKLALNDMEELLHEVKSGLYIPPKYRKIPIKQFLEKERFKYCVYLEREINSLKYRMQSTERRTNERF